MDTELTPSRRDRRSHDAEKRSEVRHRRNTLLVAVLSVVVAATVALVVGQWQSTVDRPLGIVAKWGTTNSGCGIEHAAMFNSVPEPHSHQPVLTDVSGSQDAGLWGRGLVALSLTAQGDSSYTILGLKIRSLGSPQTEPNWFYQRNYGGCGSAGDKTILVAAVLDEQELRPHNNATEPRQGDLFDPFSVTKDSTGAIKIYASACKQSHIFELVMTMQKAGSSATEQKVFGPYTVWATDSNKPVFLGEPDQTVFPSAWDSTSITQKCEF